MPVVSNSHKLVFSLTTLTLIVASPAAIAVPFFSGLGHLPGGYGTVDWTPPDISADGSVVVGTEFHSTFGYEVFRWNPINGMVGIGSGSYVSQAVSADGNAILAGGTVPNLPPIRWTLADGWEQMVSGQGASAISADGNIIAGYSSNYEAALYRRTVINGTPSWEVQALGSISNGFISTPKAMTPDASVVVGITNNQAFRWSESTGMVGIGYLPGMLNSQPTAVSANGNVVVGFSAGAQGSQSFRWTQNQGMQALDNLGWANDVSADGSVVVGNLLTSSSAGIWDSVNGTRDLASVLTNDFRMDLSNWQLQDATAISADGKTIAGLGYHRIADTDVWAPEVWLASLNPSGLSFDSALQPTITSNGWEFNFMLPSTIIDPPRIFVDPDVAVGYDFIVDSGQKISSVLFPDVGDGLFDLYEFNELTSSWDFLQVVEQGTPFNFATGGVSRFRVTGIETSAGLDPNDTTAFVTGLTFEGTGYLNLRQVALTQYVSNVPVPGCFWLFASGLAAIGFSRKKQSGTSI